RVRDVIAHLVTHHDLGAAADLDVVDDVLAVVREGTWSAPLWARKSGCPRRTPDREAGVTAYSPPGSLICLLVVMTLPRLDQRKHQPWRGFFSGRHRAGQAPLPGRTRPPTQNL